MWQVHWMSAILKYQQRKMKKIWTTIFIRYHSIHLQTVCTYDCKFTDIFTDIIARIIYLRTHDYFYLSFKRFTLFGITLSDQLFLKGHQTQKILMHMFCSVPLPLSGSIRGEREMKNYATLLFVLLHTGCTLSGSTFLCYFCSVYLLRQQLILSF